MRFAETHMKHSYLRQIDACVCLDQHEGVEGLLCNGKAMNPIVGIHGFSVRVREIVVSLAIPLRSY
ncbi:hypothetical protein CLI73_09125 [Porphyromonas gingivalis]|nr:hypothetical protein CLI73_09125 [Porphyromonas gingivalis]